MALTQAQLTTLKTAILAETDAGFVALRQANDEQGMATFYNAPSTFYVWRPITDASSILDAITWANLTPADTADGTTSFTNRALACQAKQLNLQILLQGRDSLATGRTSVRQGLSDALLNVPAGPAGALLDAGWLGAGKVKEAISRLATRCERLFVTGTGSAGVPGVLGFEGNVSAQDISDALLKG